MAIIEGLPGVEVSVYVEGSKAAEYDDPDQTDTVGTCPTITKYIESIEDAQFAIAMEATNDYNWGKEGHMLNFRPYIDGHLDVSSGISSPRVAFHSKREFHGPSGWTESQLKFASVNINDDTRKEIVTRDLEISKSLGLIKVEVERVLRIRDCAPRGNKITQQNIHLSEKALKGKDLTHGTSVSEPKKCAKPKRCAVKQLDKDPIGIFNFIYRSKDSLKRLLVIPRSPSASPAASPTGTRARSETLGGEFQSLSQDQITKLAQERYAELQRSMKMKREHSPQIKRDPDDEVVHMESRPAKRLKATPQENDEVIDLSDD